MFKNLITKLKQVMYKMNLIKGIQSVIDRKEIPVNDEMYKLIDKWKAVYSGYLPEWHDVSYHTVNGMKQRTRASLKMAKIASQKMVTLILNKKFEINISDRTLETNIINVLDDNKFYRELRRYLEYGFSLGGMVIKPYIENGKIKISFTTADCFVPLAWDNLRITEGVFVSTFRKGDKKYTHLEWHVWENGNYVVRNELYESDNESDIGIKVPLDKQFKDLEEEVIFYAVQKTVFVYFKPNIANNFDLTSPLGISIFANALDTLKSLDIAFDSFQREFVLGKKRIIVPESAVKTVVDPETGQIKRYFDADDEVYQAMKLGMDSAEIKDISVELRVDEHIAAINAFLKLFAMQIGFNANSFTFDGTGIKTATEVVSENSETFRTKQDHESNVETAIQELVDAIIEIADTFNVFPRPNKNYEVSVTFDDSIAEDQNAEIQKQIQLVSNGLNSKKRAIMKIFGLSEEDADELLAEIKSENQTVTAENIDFFGLNNSNVNNNTNANVNDNVNNNSGADDEE